MGKYYQNSNNKKIYVSMYMYKCTMSNKKISVSMYMYKLTMYKYANKMNPFSVLIFFPNFSVLCYQHMYNKNN